MGESLRKCGGYASEKGGTDSKSPRFLYFFPRLYPRAGLAVNV
jgi:hypothetical protein